MGPQLQTSTSEHLDQTLVKFLRVYTTHLSSLNSTSYLNVYEYELSPTLEVRGDRYIAVQFEANSKIQIYFKRYGLNTYVDRPLISADAGKCF